MLENTCTQQTEMKMKVHVSNHAVERYRARFPSRRNWPEEKIIEYIKQMCEKGEVAEVKPEFRAEQLLKYGIDNDTQYRLYHGTVVVIVEGLVVTLHKNEAKRWQRREHGK